MFGREPASLSGAQHFGFVTVAALTAAVASAGLTAAGVRRRDGRTILLGTAFSTMTALLAVHAIATPGVLVGPNGVIALAGAASLPAGAAVLALTALPGLRRPRRIAPLLVLQAVLAAGVLTLGVLALAVPGLLPSVPESGSTAAVALLVVGGALLRAAGPPRPADLRAHAPAGRPARRRRLLLARRGAVPAADHRPRDARLLRRPRARAGRRDPDRRARRARPPRGGASRPLVGDLSAAEIVGAEEAYLGPRVRALMAPPRRAGHLDGGAHAPRGAARRAGRRGAATFRPATLRHLAVGGLLHDIGKLSVPARILQKPGPLDDAEFAEIKRHPEAGVRLLRDLGGFPDAVHRARRRAPRAPRRRRLPGRPRRAGARHRPAHPRRLRRLRRAGLRPRLPRGLEPRAARSRSCARRPAAATTAAASARWSACSATPAPP